MGKLGILATCLATLVLSAPAFSRTLSAQDVLTVCLTTPKDPKDVLVYFYANGWSDIAEADRPVLRDKVALTFLAASGQPSEATLKETEYWAELQSFAAKLLESKTPETSFVLYHVETSAILILMPDTKAKLGLTCLLSFPAKATNSQEFHPKLPAPTAPKVFESVTDSFNSPLSRVKIITNSVSIRQPAVDEALGIKTEISVSFYTSIQYPTWAVSP